MNVVLGDEDWLKVFVEDFVKYYEKCVVEGFIVKGKVMFVCVSCEIVWDFYCQFKVICFVWFEVK